MSRLWRLDYVLISRDWLYKIETRLFEWRFSAETDFHQGYNVSDQRFYCDQERT